MSIANLFVKIFGEDIFEKQVELQHDNEPKEAHQETDAATSKNSAACTEDVCLPEQMVLIKSWLKNKFDDIEAKYKEDVLKQQFEMRSWLGSELVIFDIDFSSTVRISNDRFSVRSQGSFNTVKANVCVYGGKWMYEVMNKKKKYNNWNYLEVEETKFILKKLANALLSEFTHTNKGLEYEKQRHAIHILVCLCNHVRTRKTFLEFKFFKKHYLTLMMYIRPPEFNYMQN